MLFTRVKFMDGCGQDKAYPGVIIITVNHKVSNRDGNGFKIQRPSKSRKHCVSTDIMESKIVRYSS